MGDGLLNLTQPWVDIRGGGDCCLDPFGLVLLLVSDYLEQVVQWGGPAFRDLSLESWSLVP